MSFCNFVTIHWDELYYTAASFAGFTWLSFAFSPKYFAENYPAYNSLNRRKQMEWDMRVSSTVHAVIAFALSSYVLISESYLWADKVRNFSRLGALVMCVSNGYMISDLLFMPLCMSGLNLCLYIIHHLLVILAAFSCMHWKLGLFFFLMRLLTEVSTPFINVRWYLRACQYPSEHSYVAWSTVLFTAAFTLSRHFMLIPFWILYTNSLRTADWSRLPSNFQLLSGISTSMGITMDSLNVVWGGPVYMLGVRALRHLIKKNKNKSKAYPAQNEKPL